jgi:hypothetical protein
VKPGRAAKRASLARAARVPAWRARVSLWPGPAEALAAARPGYIPRGADTLACLDFNIAINSIGLGNVRELGRVDS